ncbi:unnamed protein product [Cylindrotheca closterium]|uniref:Uncharacterized protein n=1 Tax=Cylindrotheca closterium TaxID=2856 RepID=A0AAD2JN04_9STRA|nr:unnamed protein product [Cylindrotheca closterium]
MTRLDDQHSHHSRTQTHTSVGEGKQKKRKGRQKSVGRKERRKSSRSSSLSGRSRHSQKSDDTSPRRLRRSTDRERRRRERPMMSSSPGGNRRRKRLSKNHSLSDLRDLQHIDGSLQRSLDHGYRRSNTSPDLILQWTNRRVVGEPPQSPQNFDWADQVGTIGPPGSILPKAREAAFDLDGPTTDGAPKPAVIAEEEEKQPTTDSQQLLRLHHQMGHISFAKLQSMAKQNIIPRRLANADIPRCTACCFAKATMYKM